MVVRKWLNEAEGYSREGYELDISKGSNCSSTLFSVEVFNVDIVIQLKRV